MAQCGPPTPRGGGGSGTPEHDSSRLTDALISSRKAPLWRQSRDEKRAVIDVNDPGEVYERRGQWQILDVREPYEWEVLFLVEDVDAEAERLRGLGVEFLFGPVDRPWGHRTPYLLDPHGFVVELAQKIPGLLPRHG